MTHHLPPSSSIHGVKCSAAAFITSRPTRGLPVNRITSKRLRNSSIAVSTPPSSTRNASWGVCGMGRSEDGLIYMYTHTLIPAQIHTHTNTHTNTHKYTNSHKHDAHIRIHTHTHAYIHIHTYTHIQMYTNTTNTPNSHKHLSTHTYIHAHTRTHTHTYTHAHTHLV